MPQSVNIYKGNSVQIVNCLYPCPYGSAEIHASFINNQITITLFDRANGAFDWGKNKGLVPISISLINN